MPTNPNNIRYRNPLAASGEERGKDTEKKKRGEKGRGGGREGGRKVNERRQGRRGTEERREREEPRASCSHYLTYYTGSMPPRPSRGPTSLGFTWLPLCASHRPSASSFYLLPVPPYSPGCIPPTPPLPPRLRPLPPNPCTALFSSSRARKRDSAVVCPFLPLPSVPRPLPLLLYRRLLSRAPRPHPPSRRPRPAPAPCSSSAAPTERSHRPSAYESTESASSYRLVSLDLFLSLLPPPLSLSRRLPFSLFLSLPFSFSPSFFFLFPLSFLPTLLPPPLPSSTTHPPSLLPLSLPSAPRR